MQSKPRKHKVKAGMKFGHFTLIQRVADDNKTKSPNLKVRWRVECVCGNRDTIPIYYLTRKQPAPKSHCGCMNHSFISDNILTYRSWYMMHVRCEDVNHVAYKHYGGRGIKVCDEWHKRNGIEGFKRFLEFAGPRTSLLLSIDRVDNDGNYEPYQADGVTRQVRWATAAQQRANQGRKKIVVEEILPLD